MSEEPPTPPPDADTLLRQALASRDVPCTHCGHNLRDTTTGRCPECGRPLRIIVEADRLMRRAWIPAAALTFIAIACAASTIFTVVTIVGLLRLPFNVVIQGQPGASVPWTLWLDATFLGGVTVGAAAGTVMAWRSVRLQQRAGIVRAMWRCAVIGVLLAALILVENLAYYFLYGLP